MKKISLIIPIVLFMTFISSINAKELSQAQLNDIAAKMIPILHMLLLDDNSVSPTPTPTPTSPPDNNPPDEANVTTSIPSVVHNSQLEINITGEANTEVYVNGDFKGILSANGRLAVTLGTLEVTLNLLEGLNSFNITLKDAAGNESSPHTIETTFTPSLNAPTVQFIQDINPDNEKVTDGELAGSDTIDVKITLPSDAEIGDTLVYKDIYHTETSVDINSSMISDGYLVKLGSRILYNHYEICAKIAHNSTTSAEVCDRAQYVGENANLNVEIISDLNNDGNVSIEERNNTSEINVTVLFNDLDDSKLYTLTLITTNPNSGVQVLDLNASTIANGYIQTYTVVGNNELFTVSARLSWDNGNNISDLAEDNATIEKGYPGKPIIEITEDLNNDGIITFDELNGPIDVVVTLPDNTQVGDVLLFTNEYSTSATERTISQNDIDNGIAYEFIPESNNTYRPCVQLRNNVGNLSAKVCDEAKLAPYSHLWIYSTEYNEVEGNVDNNSSTFIHIIPTHLEEDDNVTINIDMPDDIEENMLLYYSINNVDMPIIEINATVIAAGQFEFTIDPTLGEVYTIFAKIERPHTHTKQYVGIYKFKVVDEEPTAAPTVEIIEDENNDGFIESGNELNGTVDVNITLPADAHVGDTLKITDTSGMVTNVEINQSMLDDGYLVGYTPVLENIYNIIAVIIDVSGNESAQGSDSAQLIDTYAGAPSIVFPQDIDGDGHLSASELAQATTVQVKFVFAVDTRAGDKIYIQNPNQITYQEIEITTAMMNSGYIMKEYGLIQEYNQVYRIRAYIVDSAVDPQNSSETTEETIVVD